MGLSDRHDRAALAFAVLEGVALGVRATLVVLQEAGSLLEELRAAVTQALNWGASSGADLLVGLLVGVQTDIVGMEQRLRTCAADRTLAA